MLTFAKPPCKKRIICALMMILYRRSKSKHNMICLIFPDISLMQPSEKEEFIPALANLSSGCFALKLSGKLGVRFFWGCCWSMYQQNSGIHQWEVMSWLQWHLPNSDDTPTLNLLHQNTSSRSQDQETYWRESFLRSFFQTGCDVRSCTNKQN